MIKYKTSNNYYITIDMLLDDISHLFNYINTNIQEYFISSISSKEIQQARIYLSNLYLELAMSLIQIKKVFRSTIDLDFRTIMDMNKLPKISKYIILK